MPNPQAIAQDLASDPEWDSLSQQEQDTAFQAALQSSPPSELRSPSPAQRVESRIASRSSLIPQVVRESAEAIVPNPRQMLLDLLNPAGAVSRRLGYVGRLIGAAGEVAYGVPSSAALALQRGQPRQIIPDILKTLKGQRPAQVGDVYVGAGVSEPFAAPLGFATEVALTPGGAKGITEIPRLVKSGFQAGRTGIARLSGQLGEASRGSPKAIQQAEQAFSNASHQLTEQFRSGGTYHQPLLDFENAEGIHAWSGMKTVGNVVQETIPFDELTQTIGAKYPEGGNLASLERQLIADMAGENTAASANVLIDEATRLNQKFRTPGKAVANVMNQAIHDIREAIFNAIEARLPPEASDLQGTIGQSLAKYANFAAKRNAVTRLLNPRAAVDAGTKSGASFFRKAATGMLERDDQKVFDWIQEGLTKQGLNGDVLQGLKARAANVAKVTGRGEALKSLTRGALLGTGAAGAATTIGAILQLLGFSHPSPRGSLP